MRPYQNMLMNQLFDQFAAILLAWTDFLKKYVDEPAVRSVCRNTASMDGFFFLGGGGGRR
jgi:hypothetical protein